MDSDSLDNSDQEPSGQPKGASEQDTWGALLGDLGIDASEESAKQPEPESPPQVESLVPDSYEEPVRPTSGWDLLLDDFGIEAPELDQDAKADIETSDADSVPESGDFESLASSQDVEAVEQVGTYQEASQHSTDSAIDEPPIDEPPLHQASADEEPIVESQPPAAELPSNAFGGMSQLSLPEWFPFAGRKTKAPPPPEPDTIPDLDEDRGSHAAEDSREAADEAAVVSSEDTTGTSASEASEAVANEEEGAPKRRRRRRGRRRGRGAKADAEPVEPSTDSLEESAEVAHGSAPLDDEDSEDSQEHSEGDLPESSSRKRRSSAGRSIPSWTETISVVVDANIAARSERKKSSRNGSGRGRSRGRRKKKASS